MVDDRKPVWTKAQTERYIAANFTNRISWVAARHILAELANDPGYAGLGEESRQRIERFLRDHHPPKEEKP